jgi:Y_Y_Y domain
LAGTKDIIVSHPTRWKFHPVRPISWLLTSKYSITRLAACLSICSKRYLQ